MPAYISAPDCCYFLFYYLFTYQSQLIE